MLCVSTNGISAYLQSFCLVRKAMFHLSLAKILIRFYTFFRSNLVNHFMPLLLSTSFLMTSRGYLFSMLRQLRAQQSTHSVIDVYLVHMNTMEAATMKWECQTFPIEIFPYRYLRRPSSSSQVVL